MAQAAANVTQKPSRAQVAQKNSVWQWSGKTKQGEVRSGEMEAMDADALVRLLEAIEAGGVRVHWHEAGNLGHNPLMGYWALSMGRAQSQELSKGLDRLSALATDSTATAPSDSTSTGPGA